MMVICAEFLTQEQKNKILIVFVCQCMDLAEYRTLFVLSFTTPAFDPDVAPSFGTLLATINVALSMLSEVKLKYKYNSYSRFRNTSWCLFTDREEEGASFCEHSFPGFLRGDPNSKVSKS